MKWIFVALLAFAGTAHGQSIYKCKDAKGRIEYQSAPCPEPLKRWDATPGQIYGSRSDDSTMTRAEAEARIERDRRALRSGNRRSSAQTTAVEVRIGGPGCAAAKAARDRARAAANTRWSYDAASAWDASVRNACK